MTGFCSQVLKCKAHHTGLYLLSLITTRFLYMNTTNRIVDKGKPWWSPTCAVNKLDFVPRIRTQLLPCLCKDLMQGPSLQQRLLYPVRPQLPLLVLSLLLVHKTNVDYVDLRDHLNSSTRV